MKSQNATGLCSAHKNSEHKDCKICYPDMKSLKETILEQVSNKLSQNTFDPIDRMVFRSDLPEYELFELTMKEISSALDRQLEEVIKNVQANHKGTFTDEAGYDCWYISDLVKTLEYMK